MTLRRSWFLLGGLALRSSSPSARSALIFLLSSICSPPFLSLLFNPLFVLLTILSSSVPFNERGFKQISFSFWGILSEAGTFMIFNE